MRQPQAPAGAKALTTALKIFSEFATADGELGVSTLSQRLGLPKSHVSRVLAAFRNEGWLVQNPNTQAYTVGMKAFAVGSHFLNAHRLSREALPLLRSMVDRTNFSATLSLMHENRGLYLVGLEGPHFLDFGWRSGTYFPLHASSPGKVLLAFSPSRIAERILSQPPLHSYTDATITDPRELRAHLHDVRKNGCGVSRGDWVVGVGGLSVPIFGSEGAFLGALGLVYPQAAVPQRREADHVKFLHEMSATLSLRMGAETYPFGRDSRRALNDNQVTRIAAGTATALT